MHCVSMPCCVCIRVLCPVEDMPLRSAVCQHVLSSRWTSVSVCQCVLTAHYIVIVAPRYFVLKLYLQDK
jgi:hypothetical protein